MRALSILIKPASASCNMRCGYCFYADVSRRRAVRNYGAMSLETLEVLVKSALAEATEFCSFGFQGGEPTLVGLDFFRNLMEFEKRHNVNGARIVHTLQTNGLLIDEAWARFLAENGFLVGLSVDGPKEVHDGLRLDAQKRGTHRRCMEAATRLRKSGAQFNILSVVSRALAGEPAKVYKFYKQRDFKHVQFIPCLEGLGEAPDSSGFAPDAGTYARFLCRIFDLWRADFARGDYVSIRTFDNYVHILGGYPPESCAMNGFCAAYPLVEADGSVYPCDFYALDKYRLGRVGAHSFAEMLEGDAARDFAAPSLEPHPDCLACEYGFICRGGCRRDREESGGLSLNRHCRAYKIFFAHALPGMREIAGRVFG